MKFKCYKIVSLICIIILFNCNYKIAICETNKSNDKIKEGSVQEFSKYELIIRFSNLIYEEDEKKIKIPIFQGNMNDVTYEEFLEYCYYKKYLRPKSAETFLIIKTEKGKLTKTFQEFLMFYKGSILKNVDIRKPAKIKADGGALDIFYDFKVDGVPFILHLNISTGKKDIDTSLIKSIFDINLNENMGTPVFRYRFWANSTSKEF